MRKIRFLLCLTMFVAGLALAFDIPTGNEASLMLREGASENIVFDYSGTALRVEGVSGDGELFARLTFEGSYVGGEIGKPELPVMRVIVQIPFGSTPKIRIIERESEFFCLSELGCDMRIIPRQPPGVKLPGYEAPFTLDEETYSTDRFVFGDRVKIIDVSAARSFKIALIEIRPVDYNPVDRTISVLRSLSFAVETPGSDLAETRRIKERYACPAFDNILRPFLANPDAFSIAERWVPDVASLGFLIVAGDSYVDSARVIADWKSRKGYSVKLRSVSDLGGTASSIRSWILSEYDTAAVAPTFVLLIGDIGDVPSFTGGSSGSETDTPYGNMDGSGYIPELFVGRISPANSSQLGHFIHRTIDYEHFDIPTGHEDFADKACFLASNDGTFWALAEATHRYAVQTHFGPAGFTCDTIKAHSDPNHHIHTIQAINDGRMIVNYSGHGGYYSWAAPELDANDVEALTNYGEYPFVISNACVTGTFHLSECFGETWIRQLDKGAIGFLGASDNSYWDEDDEMERRMFDYTFDDEYYFMAGMMNTGLYGVYLAYPSNANYYYDEYNLLGDPSVALWFRAPEPLVGGHSSTITVGGDIAINISSGGSPLEEALVCATNDDAVHSVGYTNASGNITLATSGADMGDTIWITATAYNKIPYEGYAIVTGSGPWISLVGVETDDPSGDNDDVIDIGEEIDFTITILNSGTESAFSVDGFLRTANPEITPVDTIKSYGNIPVGVSRSNTTPFTCEFGAGISDGGNVEFSLHVGDAADSSWDLTFFVPVAAPVTGYVSHVIDDTPGGDGDGYPEPGEDFFLTATIDNSGGETARFMLIELAALPNPYVTVTSGVSGVDSIPPGEIRQNFPAFGLSVDAGCPTPYSVDLVLSAADYRGPVSIDTFSLSIGEAGFFDDCEAGTGDWTPDAFWHITQRRWTSPGHSWYSGIEDRYMHHDTIDVELISPEVVAPENPALTFWHYYLTEHNYDSCFVYYSTDGGSSWPRLGGYNGPSGGWRFARFDLSSRAVTPGAPVQFKFIQTADTYVHGEGWFLDDISLAQSQVAYLGAGSVDPFAGNTGTQFKFIVRYASPDGYTPSNARIILDDSSYVMTFSGVGELTTSGIVYKYDTYLPAGGHSYHYEFTTGGHTLRFPATGEIDGPFVSAPFYEFDIGHTSSGLSHYGPTDDWEYGAPSSGPTSVPIGTRCWATQIDGSYRDSSRSRLVLPAMDLTEIDLPYLCFYHWYRFQGASSPFFHDGGNVKIAIDGSPDTFIVHPQFGYDGTASQYNHFVKWETIYGDDDIGNFWQFEAIDLSPWTGHIVTVCFDFGSSSANVEAGWYINNVYLVGVSETGEIHNVNPEFPERLSISASPNPFNSAVDIQIRVPDKNCELRIYDISGRLTADLSERISEKSETIRWEARDVPSGLYFAKLVSGEASAEITLILVK